ncbi:hypothetical protein BDV96DRAFT_485866 [Lophiotrema nucula]|uniref:Uncharacterized protein n=1 Tax=Lophiotrema nucula TaxID=690887 RepID=A0A6A5ZPX9_9PLEO|nr:hypothetical protein BDV96DRAFT_485866 [Lophiotrema nucula]
MAAILSPIRALLNLLLPFTDKNTPLVQDLIHTIVLCGTLYFAPQLVELYHSRKPSHIVPEPPDPEETEGTQEDLPRDDGWVLQPDTEDEAVERPPPAPTPPPGQNGEPAGWLPPDDAPPQFLDGEGEAGPANFADNDRPRPTPANRTVGAKKAKSLARKDQRRAYHEFHRQQAELRRQEEAKEAPAREAALLAEKQRRAEVEKEIQENARKERERKKEEERKEQEEESKRRERALRTVRELFEKKGAVDLGDVAWKEDKNSLWIERLVRASGLLSQASKRGESTHIMITGGGWLVRIDEDLMRQAYTDAIAFGNKRDGKVSFSELGGMLEKAVRARAKA